MFSPVCTADVCGPGDIGSENVSQQHGCHCNVFFYISYLLIKRILKVHKEDKFKKSRMDGQFPVHYDVVRYDEISSEYNLHLLAKLGM